MRARIAKLPVGNVRLYFSGVKEVIDEINEERERIQVLKKFWGIIVYAKYFILQNISYLPQIYL